MHLKSKRHYKGLNKNYLLYNSIISARVTFSQITYQYIDKWGRDLKVLISKLGHVSVAS
jgi:hypothetical protein